ncbi:MAG: hypothetical protein [Kajamanuvirus moutis]|uniref:Uncharacterized protein n=1 Tax=Cressdnaviricota sp. TaxID=2748378 RepID=A0A345MYE0_9VIRU|nr:MAG: hypothetical protein [Cressdnaviricota sp.]
MQCSQKQSTGCSQSRITTSCLGNPPEYNSSKVNSNPGKNPIICTGNSSWSPTSKADWQQLNEYLASPCIVKQQSPPQQKTTYGKKRPLSLEQDLNSENAKSSVIVLRIGSESNSKRLKANLTKFLQIFSLEVITPSRELAWIMHGQIVGRFGAEFLLGVPAVESLTLPGVKPVWMLTQKILSPSFGTVIKAMKTWLSTNFEALSVSPISLDGWIAIQCSSRLKEVQPSSKQRTSGSQAIYIQDNGIQNSTP